jgi:hypothetical protein
MKINILLIGPNGCCLDIFKNILESNSSINNIDSKIITCKKISINDNEYKYVFNNEIFDDINEIEKNYNYIILLTRENNCLNLINNYDNFSNDYYKIINNQMGKYLDKLIFFDYESIILYKDSYIKYMIESLNLNSDYIDNTDFSKYYFVDLNSDFFKIN